MPGTVQGSKHKHKPICDYAIRMPRGLSVSSHVDVLLYFTQHNSPIVILSISKACPTERKKITRKMKTNRSHIAYGHRVLAGARKVRQSKSVRLGDRVMSVGQGVPCPTAVADWPRTSSGPPGERQFAQCSQFSNCTGTVRTTMMFTVSILPLVVLLSERAPWAFCSPTSDGNGVSSNDTARTSGVWFRPYGALVEEDQRFYTLDDGSPRATTLRPRARSPKRSAKLRREPRFISFETKDNSIEVEIDFAIPFLSIPIQKSMNGVMSSVLKGTPLLNVNLGAVVLAGVLTAGGALVGAAARTFSNSSLLPGWTLPLTPRPAI
ncbi:hypothetical protein ZHAS_00011977 [Anopheles sinensis]|uniref:Uncharacterized protein n=1 Tax=Anopheles sinensis TaxID=74873 RepID=A0A084W1P6_ANOSI|nr:hypothetical protein ZHAS_00011977 [Anopheles sinensis]